MSLIVLAFLIMSVLGFFCFFLPIISPQNIRHSHILAFPPIALMLGLTWEDKNQFMSFFACLRTEVHRGRFILNSSAGNFPPFWFH